MTDRKETTLKVFKIQNSCCKFMQAYFRHTQSTISLPFLPIAHLTIPCPCLDKLFESFTHLTGEPQVIPSARKWRWSKDPGPKGNMANILTFTVPDAACSSVDELICLLEKVNALMGEVTNTMLQYFSKCSLDVTGFESTPIQNEIVHQRHRIYRVFLTGQESKGYGSFSS